MGLAWEGAEASYLWGRWLLLGILLLLVLYQGRRSLDVVRLGRELALVLLAVFTYFAVREITEGSRERAVANGALLVDLERALGIFWEPAMQRAIVDHHSAVTVANWMYIWGHWPLITVVALWLFLRRPDSYRLYRNAFIISGAIGLVIFTAFPVAPPRLAGVGVVDTVTAYSHAYRVLQPPTLINQYAAVPSLHFGWNLLIGMALVREARALWARALGLTIPPAMLLAVILTANHYILDAVAGAIVAGIGLWLAWKLRPVQAAGEAEGSSPALADEAGPLP